MDGETEAQRGEVPGNLWQRPGWRGAGVTLLPVPLKAVSGSSKNTV